MEKIKEKRFWDIYYNTKLNILEFHWKNIGKDIEQDSFKEYLLEVVELLKTYTVNTFLVDGSKYHVTIPPSIQEWHDNTIIPAYLKAGIKRMIFVLNQEDLIPVLSLEQTFDEKQAKALQTHFVESLEKARSLIKS